MSKPTSKVIQILRQISDGGYSMMTVLCEDGSIWERENCGQWVCILEAFKNENLW